MTNNPTPRPPPTRGAGKNHTTPTKVAPPWHPPPGYAPSQVAPPSSHPAPNDAQPTSAHKSNDEEHAKPGGTAPSTSPSGPHWHPYSLVDYSGVSPVVWC